jgi:hypothetical protein
MRWSIMSKAALRSKLIRVEGLPSSEDRKLLYKVTTRTVSVPIGILELIEVWGRSDVRLEAG